MLRAAGQIPLSGLTLTNTVASGSAVSLTTATTANVTSRSFLAGTYLIWGTVNFTETAASVTLEQAGISATTATLPTQAGGSGVGTDPLATRVLATTTATQTDQLQVLPVIVTLAATTTIFLVAQGTFSAGTLAAYGTMTALQTNVA